MCPIKKRIHIAIRKKRGKKGKKEAVTGGELGTNGFTGNERNVFLQRHRVMLLIQLVGPPFRTRVRLKVQKVSTLKA